MLLVDSHNICGTVAPVFLYEHTHTRKVINTDACRIIFIEPNSVDALIRQTRKVRVRERHETSAAVGIRQLYKPHEIRRSMVAPQGTGIMK